MPGISIHVVDVTHGIPAQGMQVHVHRVDARRRDSIAHGEVGSDGVVKHPMTTGAGITRGVYEVELAVGAYYRARGIEVGTPAFQETAVYRFSVIDEAEHYHLPIKLSPWGLSIWRGR